MNTIDCNIMANKNVHEALLLAILPLQLRVVCALKVDVW